LNFHLDDSRQGGAEDFLCLFMRCESRSGNSIIRIPWLTPGLLDIGRLRFRNSCDNDSPRCCTARRDFSETYFYREERKRSLVSDLYNVAAIIIAYTDLQH